MLPRGGIGVGTGHRCPLPRCFQHRICFGGRVTETVWGEGTVSFEPSEDDPTHLLKPKRIIGASLASGNQVLPWGVVLSE